MPRYVAFLVFPDPVVHERYELIDMKGRILKDKEDALRWLAWEAPKRPDLAGRRIDIVDIDESVPGAH